jgi:hypothetical protein
MWVRVLRAAPRRSTFGSVALRANISTPSASPAVRVDRLCTSKERGWAHERKVAAHEALKDAVKELSEGEAVPFSYSTTASLLEWNATPLVDLSIDQLEELARAFFEGVPGMPKDHTRAVEIWTQAALREHFCIWRRPNKRNALFKKPPPGFLKKQPPINTWQSTRVVGAC